MIGYYVHHHGSGHLHRAIAIAAATDRPITGLSSLPRPAGWRGEWVRLDRDDTADAPVDVDAGGRLHWVPVQDSGLRSRMAAIAAWIGAQRPSVMVVDVSVEIALLARLHGVRVVTVAMPGYRGDEPHALGYAIADAVLGCWPPGLRSVVRGVSRETEGTLHTVGAISRFRRSADDPRPVPNTVLLLSGAGGSALTSRMIDRARDDSPDWHWTVLDGTPERWVDDPWPLICAAGVVVTHAGQNALADVAAAARPAIVVPQDRPHDEQGSTARALDADGSYPVIVQTTWPETGWSALLDAAQRLDGDRWRRWNDGRGAERAAEIVGRIADRSPVVAA